MDQLSLWGEDFSVKEEDVSKIVKKVKQPKKKTEMSTEKAIKSKSVSIAEKMELIKTDVYRILGGYVEDTQVIRSYEDLIKYFDACIENGIVAVDTETNNTLDIFGDCKLMGLCLYTPGQKNAYVPVNHCKFKIELDEKCNEQIVEEDLLENQVNEQQVAEQLRRLENTNCLFHNATFDIEVLNKTCGVKLKAYWDSLVGAQLLDENELKGLKIQYKLHINPEQDKYDIEHLFKGLPYSIFDPELFALYAATDAKLTYDLYLYQKEQFELPENKDVYTLFREVEIPVIDAIVNMETAGVCVDLPYAKKMSEIFHKKADEVQSRVDAELNNLKPLIDNWKLTPEANAKKRVYPAKKTKMSEADIIKKFDLIDEKGKRYKMSSKTPVEQLSDPIDVGSTTQLQILLYDIMQVPVMDKGDPRGTGADILELLAEEKHVKICELLLEKRGVEILINTFIDAIPTFVKDDGKVHARFNQCGTATGRFSSTTPNLQQIPSHSKTIRMIFKAEEGRSIIGSDFSGQEVRVLASASNDEEMIKAYAAKKDLYAQIGALAFKVDYEDCLEFDLRKGGQLNPDGKERRSKSKTLLLGLNYGMSVKSLADRLGYTIEEAQEIIDKFYAGFTGVDKYTKDSQKMLKEKGYVTDIWGRRRHIPDAQLPDYTIKPANGKSFEFNPLIGSIPHEDKALQAKIKQYEDKLKKCKWKKDKDAVIEQAKKEGFKITNNQGFINRAMRQCLNARIQGSSASMTKYAMVLANSDPELLSMDVRLLATVHDELLATAPTECSERAAQRLCEVMVEAAQYTCGNVAWKCDPYVVKAWYEDEATSNVKNDYNKLIKKGLSEDDAKLRIIKDYEMFTAKGIQKILDGTYEVNTGDIKILKGQENCV